MEELWQLYNDQGQPLTGQGGNRDDVYGKGLLHGASHVWIWRKQNGTVEILLQKRATDKRTWPGRFDISAAGHIDVGEDPITAAIRETSEEIGVTVSPHQLISIGTYRIYMKTENGAIENEFQWLYLLELPSTDAFTLQTSEVEKMEWQPLKDFALNLRHNPDAYVPHSAHYYQNVITSVERVANTP